VNQEQVRKYVERYLAAFSSHVMESHPDYLTVKLPVEVDKDIGNRPFYWSWVEKMNIPPQPLVLTFFFDPERAPEGMRAEHLHFGSNRLQQIFQSTRKHGRFVCMYEQHPQLTGGRHRRSHPLTPWLGLNLKISLLCDKKRDILLYMGVNLHQPRIVQDFYPFLRQLSLSPAIPDYCYTLERRVTLQEAFQLAEQETRRLLAREDHRWADEARTRLEEELAILEAYYNELAEREKERGDEVDSPASVEENVSSTETGSDSPVEAQEPFPAPAAAEQPLHDKAQTVEEFRSGGGRILDFLRMNSIPVTPREEINQQEWRKSTPQEEKERRMAELRWQYEPRIEVQFINGGLFYLHNMPPFRGDERRKM
jgi:hypothetical protein